jgi:hypothetical protein
MTDRCPENTAVPLEIETDQSVHMEYDESPLSYSATMEEMERQPLLQDFDPPPDYTDPGFYEYDELPSYQQVQEESI